MSSDQPWADSRVTVVVEEHPTAAVPEGENLAKEDGVDGLAATDPETRRRLPWIFGALMLSMLMSSLGQMIFSTALPTIVGELGGVQHMSWVMSGFLVGEAISLPIFGKLGDQVGRKNLFLFVNILFIFGSALGGMSTSMNMLIFARVVQGIAGGGMMVLSQSITADVTTVRERGKFMGVMGSVFAVSSVLGPVLGGWFTDGPGWRWGLWLNVPIGIIAVLAIFFLLHLPPRQKRFNPDYWGILTMIVATTSLILTTTWAGTEHAWTSPLILSLIATTVIFSVLFVLAERRHSDPLIPLYIFRNRNFVLTTITGLGLGIFMFGAMAYMPTYLQMVHSLLPTKAGLMMITMMLGIMLTSISVGNLISRTGRYKIFPLVGMAIVVVALVLLSTMKYDTPLWVFGIYMFIFGFGLGGCMQVLVLIVQNSFPISEVGTVTAANNFFRQIGSSLGAALVGGLFVKGLTTQMTANLPEAFAKMGPAGASFAERFAAGGTSSMSHLTPSLAASLPEPIHDAIRMSYNDALTPIFLLLAPFAAVCVIVMFFITEESLEGQRHH